ncbi:carboxypeptidase-like regulatory domain-containing protein [uncultured Paludibaculum sp.]|uniref:carboxypeptidase-like regulatory domain-containing protein n=1 Tax=uncultured Paludibaculum sp. TaxID=1765020 RepID=UPI002AAA6F6B|nr:carboxypeptidase-like regulatory domain-containing protein [uncultured Paludibaculum sp.]
MRRRRFARSVVGLTVLFAMANLSQNTARSSPTQENWTVSGTVTDESGPAEALFVSISGPQSIRPMRTDEQGRYSFQGGEPGLYTIRVQKRGGGGEPAPRFVRLVAGLRLIHVDFRIPQGGVVSGQVLDEMKRPVEGLLVTAFAKSADGAGLRLSPKGLDKTNDRGEYRIPGLPDGRYVIAARMRPLAVRNRLTATSGAARMTYPALTLYPAGRSLLSALAVELRSGEEKHGIDLTVQKEPAHCIDFQVSGAVSDPHEPVSVYLNLKEWVGADGPILAEGPLTPGAPQQVCGLAPGEYRLHAYSFTKHGSRGIGYGGALAIVGKEDADLGVVPILPAGALRGTVTVKDGKPDQGIPAGVRIRLIRRGRDLMANDTLAGPVSPDGAVALEHVYASEYGVQVDGLPDGYYVHSAMQQGKDVQGGGLFPANGPLVVVLGADGPTVRGHVQDEAGKPVPDSFVCLLPRDGGKAVVVPGDQDGVYSISSGIRAGDYRIVALTGLYEAERQSPEAVDAYTGKAAPLHLGARATRTLDLKAQQAR